MVSIGRDSCLDMVSTNSVWLCRSLFVSRLVPLDRFCVANAGAVTAAAKELIDAHPRFSSAEPVKV